MILVREINYPFPGVPSSKHRRQLIRVLRSRKYLCLLPRLLLVLLSLRHVNRIRRYYLYVSNRRLIIISEVLMRRR